MRRGAPSERARGSRAWIGASYLAALNDLELIAAGGGWTDHGETL